ncbi:MAG: flagellar biosynthesis anti-sigma factor FlgM [Chitinispirillaceae bacterium]|nr:flagellar biosynthesis anti-sigma factor FlgM [Chitinispirillaceae bacterium]
MDIKNVSAAYMATTGAEFQKIERKSSSSGKAVSNERKEQVEITELSKSMQKIMEAIDILPDVRIQIVEEIKTKIKYNGYPIESSLYKSLEKLISNKIV